MCFNQFTNVQSFLCSFVVLPHLYRIGDWTLSCRLNSLSGCCFAFPEKRPRIMPNPLSTTVWAVWLWSLASERPRMFCPTMHDRFKNMHHPHLAPVRAPKATAQTPTDEHPPTRINWSMDIARFPHDVDSVQHCKQQNRKEVKNAFYLWPPE